MTCPTCREEAHGSRSCCTVPVPVYPSTPYPSEACWGPERQVPVMVLDLDTGGRVAMVATITEAPGGRAVANLGTTVLVDTASGMRERARDAARDAWWSKSTKRRDDPAQAVLRWE